MSKSLCKFNRRDIADNLGSIHSLVSETKFVCTSCARASNDSSYLCKPTAIPMHSTKSESAPKANVVAVSKTQKQTKKELKKIKKETKKQSKQFKKLAKIIKKKDALIKKQNKIKMKFMSFEKNQIEEKVTAQLH